MTQALALSLVLAAPLISFGNGGGTRGAPNDATGFLNSSPVRT